jgi:hypothetical protein
LCADIPTLPADCSVAAGAVSRAHLTQLLELCCSVKVTFLHVAPWDDLVLLGHTRSKRTSENRQATLQPLADASTA